MQLLSAQKEYEDDDPVTIREINELQICRLNFGGNINLLVFEYFFKLFCSNSKNDLDH